MHRRLIVLGLTFAVLAGSSFASLATAKPAGCLVVNGRSGQSFGGLQAAHDAVTTVAGDTLRVAGTCYGDTTISKDNLKIVGAPGFGPATLNGGNSATAPGVVVTINAGVTSELDNLSVTGGDNPFVSGGSNGSGGGIVNNGSLTLFLSNVTGNSADSGGGIVNNSSLRLTLSTVRSNTINSVGTGHGGGILNYGSLELNGSIVSNNTVGEGYAGDGTGGGIQNSGGTVTLTNTLVTRNTVVGQFLSGGGGIANTSGSVTLTNSIVAGNSAFDGGGISNAATLTLTRSLLLGNTAANDGGGLLNGYRATATLTNTIVARNSATSGGGIYDLESVAPGSVTLGHTTVTGNSASGGVGSGGGIYNLAPGFFTLSSDSTVTGNTPDDCINC